MIFSFYYNGNPVISSLPLNDNTVGRYCRGTSSEFCSVYLIPKKLKAKILFDTILFIGKEEAQVIVTFKKFPYIFGKHDNKKESVCYKPKFEDGEWEFCQELRKDLNNRKRVIFTDETTGRSYMAKCVKCK